MKTLRKGRHCVGDDALNTPPDEREEVDDDDDFTNRKRERRTQTAVRAEGTASEEAAVAAAGATDRLALERLDDHALAAFFFFFFFCFTNNALLPCPKTRRDDSLYIYRDTMATAVAAARLASSVPAPSLHQPPKEPTPHRLIQLQQQLSAVGLLQNY